MKHWFRVFLVFALFSFEAQAAFPTISGITYGEEEGANVTTHNHNLPPTIVAGDLIVVLGAVDNSTNGTFTFDNTTAGTFTEAYLVVDSNNLRGIAFVKDAVGNEDGLTMGHSTSGLEMSSWYSFIIPAAEWFGTIATGVYDATTNPAGTGTDVDPPNLAPGVGAEDFLWIAVAHADSNKTVSVFSEADNQNESTNTHASGALLAFSSASVNAASRDPGAYTISAAEQRIAATIGIRPAAGSVRIGKWDGRTARTSSYRVINCILGNRESNCGNIDVIYIRALIASPSQSRSNIGKRLRDLRRSITSSLARPWPSAVHDEIRKVDFVLCAATGNTFYNQTGRMCIGDPCSHNVPTIHKISLCAIAIANPTISCDVNI